MVGIPVAKSTPPLPEVVRSDRPRVQYDPIPFSLPDLGDDEKRAVVEAMDSGWVTSGPQMAAFETEFADFVGGDVEAVATTSATAGLHLALEACGVGPGDEVIVPTWTFTATAEVVRYLGAKPVLVDIDPVTLNIDPVQVESALTPRTRAILPVHMAGLSADMPAVAAIARPRGIKIIEDAAHALPTASNGHTVGSLQWSDAAVFSFYANKTITTGEGGMVTTRDPAMAARMRTMRLHGISRDVFDRYRSTRPSWAYDVVAPGFKYNMPDIAAAMGRVQLRRAHEMRSKRAAIAECFLRSFAGLPVQVPATSHPDDGHAWHLFILRLTNEARISRDGFIAAMSEQGIGTSVHFTPLHRLTYWRNSLGPFDVPFPNSDTAFDRVVSLPLFSRMTESQIERVVNAVRQLLL